MKRKSDSRPRRRVAATAASREFSRLLDEVERGGRVLIHRHGRDVGLLAPPALEGRPASECRAMLLERAASRLDGRFGADLLAVLAAEGTEEPPRWDS